MVFLEELGLDWETRAPLLLRPNDEPRLGPPRLAHLTAGQYVAARWVPQEMFDAYFKFAVVRNPFTRMVSHWRYSRSRQPFPSFIRRVVSRHEADSWFTRPQTEFTMIDGRDAMDHIIRIEALTEGFEVVRSRLSLRPELPHRNASSSAKTAAWFRIGRVAPARPWRDEYDDEAERLVRDHYAADFEAYGYPDCIDRDR
jgi:hypothetical protein